MRRFMLRGLILAGALMAGPAHASLTTVYNARGSEVTLYNSNKGGFNGTSTSPNIMDTLYGNANYVRVDESTAQLWSFTKPNAHIEITAKYAGFNNILGFISPGSAASTLTGVVRFTGNGGVSGSPLPGADSAAFSIVDTNYAYYVDAAHTTIGIRNSLGSPLPPLPFLDPFAWGVQTPVDPLLPNYWSSEIAQNSDTSANQAHFVVFQITGNAGAAYAGNNIGNYVIAVEDKSAASGSDRDFNDAVFEIANLRPIVPEPSTLAIAGMGALGFGVHAWRRRVRKGKKS